MDYPSIEQVDRADREQLARWYRFLRSPGAAFVECPNEEFQMHLEREARIMNRICDRFRAMGMFTSELSKLIGWEE